MINTNTWTPRPFSYESAGNTGIRNVYQSDNVYTDENGLHIRAEKGVNEYVSGWIDTVGKKSWLYGYFETRMRFPNVPGIWGGFFAVNEGGYPPEIDMGEVFRNDGNVQFQIRKGDADYKLSYGVENLYDWHTFGFLWKPDKISWYIDGTRRWETSSYVPSVPMNLFFNLGMGEWQEPNDSQLPATLDIDYIRVWQ